MLLVDICLHCRDMFLLCSTLSILRVLIDGRCDHCFCRNSVSELQNDFSSYSLAVPSGKKPLNVSLSRSSASLLVCCSKDALVADGTYQTFYL